MRSTELHIDTNLLQLLNYSDVRFRDCGTEVHAEPYSHLGGKVADRNGDKVMVVIAAHWAKAGGQHIWAPTRVEVWNLCAKTRIASVTAGKKYRKAIEMLKPFM